MQWTMSLLAACASAGLAQQSPPVTLRASVPQSVRAGDKLDVLVEVLVGQGWSVGAAGIPEPVLQIGVPEGVTLDGKVLSEREQARNEWLFSPYERTIRPGESTITLIIDRDSLATSPTLAINLIAYARKSGEENAVFVRRRVELPLVAGTTMSSDQVASRSNWGPPGFDSLNIGDKAQDFTLPRGNASTLALGDVLGKGDVIVTTYRAFW